MNEHQKELIDLKLSLCRRLMDLTIYQEKLVAVQKENEDANNKLVYAITEGILKRVDNEVTYFRNILDMDK